MLTRSSVLRRAGQGDADDLARIYAPLVFSMARARGLRDEEAEDVAQQVMLELLERLRGFDYDRSRGTFKGLLKKFVRDRIIDRARRNRPTEEILETVVDPGGGLDEAFEREWLQVHLETALDRVRNEVQPTTFQAFDLLVLKGWPIPKVAELLGHTSNHLAQSKRRVIQRLRHHLEDLLDEA